MRVFIAGIDGSLKGLLNYKERILVKKEVLISDIRWDGTRRKVVFLERKEKRILEK